MDGELQYSPDCFIAANVVSISVFRDLVHLLRVQCKGFLVTILVYILQYALDGPDGYAQFYIAVAVEEAQQILMYGTTHLLSISCET